MNTLTLTLKQEPVARIDCSPITPTRLAGKSLPEIERIPLKTGHGDFAVGDVFALSGNAGERIVFTRGSRRLFHVGAALGGGTIIVEGDVGGYCAHRMAAGEILVRGSTDAFAACEMRAGVLTIEGNAGDFLGAALIGAHRGMSGGRVFVKGSAGDRCGDHLRRGEMFVEGDVGAFCASRMSGGTIAVNGRCGEGLGFSMKRGSVLLRDVPDMLPPTFADCGSHALPFLPLLAASWNKLPTSFSKVDGMRQVRRWVGDLAFEGRGELLIV